MGRWVRATVLLLALASCSDDPSSPPGPRPSGTPVPGTQLVGVPTGDVVDLDGDATRYLTAGDGQLVARVDDDVVRVDPGTGTVTNRFPAPGDQVAAGFGSIWVSRFDDGVVVRHDARSGAVTATIRAGRNPGHLLAAHGAVWVSDHRGGVLLRIDPSSDRVTARVRLGPAGSSGPQAITDDGRHLFVGVPNAGRVAEVDPVQGAVVATYDVPEVFLSGPVSVTADAVWATGLDTDEEPATVVLVRIDRAGGPNAVSPPLAGAVGDGIAADGLFWVPTSVDAYPDDVDRLVGLDGEARPVASGVLPVGGDAAVPAGGRWWVSGLGTGDVVPVDVERLRAP